MEFKDETLKQLHKTMQNMFPAEGSLNAEVIMNVAFEYIMEKRKQMVKSQLNNMAAATIIQELQYQIKVAQDQIADKIGVMNDQIAQMTGSDAPGPYPIERAAPPVEKQRKPKHGKKE